MPYSRLLTTQIVGIVYLVKRLIRLEPPVLLYLALQCILHSHTILIHTISMHRTYITLVLYLYIEGILHKGPYPPCLRVADRALLAGYPRYLVYYLCCSLWQYSCHRAVFYSIIAISIVCGVLRFYQTNYYRHELFDWNLLLQNFVNKYSEANIW